jgi:hypothetical protein
MTSHPTDNCTPDPTNDRNADVVALYRSGRRPSEIVKFTGLSKSRVNAILREYEVATIKRLGTEGIRSRLVADLELVRRDLEPILFVTDKEGTPLAATKAMSQYLRAISQQGALMGAAAAGPVYGEGDLPREGKERRAYNAYQKFKRDHPDD